MEDDAIGPVVGVITAIIAFLAAWVYCMANYGFLFGFGLGWLPAAILAVISGVAMRFLWPLVVLGLLAVAALAIVIPMLD